MTNRDQALVQQLRLSAKNPNYKIFIPDKSKSYVWHISYKGPVESDFDGGIYHAVVDLEHYPQQAPKVAVVTPSGTYQVGENLCLIGITHYHPEGWSQGTSIEGIVNAVSAYMIYSSRAGDGIGMIRTSSEECKKLAQSSLKYSCKQCGCDHATLFTEKPKKKEEAEKVEQVKEVKVVQKKKIMMDLSDD
uniref:Ubiquitin-conjugating enzyme E2 n=1 Tax=Trepomonas sp. PC1 TaxID=1076344 RepID=A0A146KJ04_9EUKA|eukprot:JAP95814.1 Ubiquitin-conjugating enzyme E2 [Trepomonas sp. PC1]